MLSGRAKIQPHFLQDEIKGYSTDEEPSGIPLYRMLVNDTLRAQTYIMMFRFVNKFKETGSNTL